MFKSKIGVIVLRLDAENEDLIAELKKPFGRLYPDFEDAIDEIKSSEFLISVGDATFANLTKYELYPNIGIIDNLIQSKNQKVSQRGLGHPLLQTWDQGAEASWTWGSAWLPTDPQTCSLTETWLLPRVFWA